MGDVDRMRGIVTAVNEWKMTKQWLTQCDKKGRTPLHLASLSGYMKVVRFIVKEIVGSTKDEILRKQYVNLPDNKGRTPLFHAAAQGRPNVVRFLIERDADLEAATNESHTEPGSTALMACAEKNNLECFSSLLDKGANVLAIRKDGADATYMAARYGHVKIIQEIAESEKMKLIVNRPSFRGRTPILTAAFHGHIKVCKVLHGKGADLDHQDDDKFTALIYAASQGHFDIVRWLVKKGANLYLKDRYQDIASTSADAYGHPEIAKYLRMWNRDGDSNNEPEDLHTKLEQSKRISGRALYPSDQMLPKKSSLKRISR